MSKILPFKDRKIDYESPVEIYRNLNRSGKIYSVRQNGLVVGHGTDISLWEGEFVVNESGKKRALKTGQRNVHAFIRGKLAKKGITINNDFKKILYLPFEDRGFHFYDHRDGLPTLTISALEAYMVRINESGVHASVIITAKQDKKSKFFYED